MDLAVLQIVGQSKMKIELNGGNITATGGIANTANTSKKPAAIGAGASAVMDENSIKIGDNVSLNCTSEGNSPVSTDTVENGIIPSITVNEDSYNVIVRFSGNSEEKIITLYEEDKVTKIKEKVLPANNTSAMLDLPGPGTYYLQIGDGEKIKIVIGEGEGFVTGKIENGEFVADSRSKPLTNINVFERDTNRSIVTNNEKFSEGKKAYDFYTEYGTNNIDVYFEWQEPGTTIITVDGQTVSPTKNAEGKYYIRVQKSITENDKVSIIFIKNDLNDTKTAVKYTVNIQMAKKYTLTLADLNKTYDGKLVVPVASCIGANYKEEDNVDIKYTYYDEQGNELNITPKSAGKYQVQASLKKETYIAESTRIPFEISKRKISIKAIENYMKVYDGTNNLSSEQKNNLGKITYSNVVGKEEVNITYNKETSHYDKIDDTATTITLEEVVSTNPNYEIAPTQTVYGEIMSGVHKAIFESDDGKRWDKTLGEKHIENCNTHSINIKGRTTGEGEEQAVYSADIEWGSMEFTYSNGGWDTFKHEYVESQWISTGKDTNKLRVTNRSNRNINLSASTKLEFEYMYDLKLGLSENSDSKVEDAQTEFSKTVEYKKDAYSKNVLDLFVILNGVLPELNHSTKIGTLTLNIWTD